MSGASFQREVLDAHNAYRAMHGAKPLTLSSELNAAAQKWADRLLSLGLLNHSDTKDGENIYTSFNHDLTGKEVVDSWYNEVQNYNWSSPGFSSNTGHFTQVVWKDSTELGVGVASVGRRAYVVSQYRPAGNVQGYFERNVLPKGGREVEKSGNSSGGDGDDSKRRKCCILL